MTDVFLREAVPADAHAITLRPSDLHEGSLWVPGWDVHAVLASSIENSTEAWAAEEDGVVIALGGYTVQGSQVTPWLMCSSRVRHHARTLMRSGRRLLAFLRAEYPHALICNHVHRPNTEARAFIETLGFRVVPSPGNAEFDFFYLPPCA